MLERLALALCISAAAVIVWLAVNRLAVRRLAAGAARDPLLAGALPDVPTIVYFTTPFCAPCRTQQMPALRQLQAEVGEGRVQIIQIDATADPAAADRWGVFSAPTTFVLDARQQPRHVNRGVASAAALKAQLGLG